MKISDKLREHLNEILDIMNENPGLELILRFYPDYRRWNTETLQDDIPCVGVLVNVRSWTGKYNCLVYGSYVHHEECNCDHMKKEIFSFFAGTHVNKITPKTEEKLVSEADLKKEAVRAKLRASKPKNMFGGL